MQIICTKLGTAGNTTENEHLAGARAGRIMEIQFVWQLRLLEQMPLVCAQIEFPDVVQVLGRGFESTRNDYLDAIVTVRLLNAWMETACFGVATVGRHLRIRLRFYVNESILAKAIRRYSFHIEWCVLCAATENVNVLVVVCNLVPISARRILVTHIIIWYVQKLPRACLQVKSMKTKKKMSVNLRSMLKHTHTQFRSLSLAYLWISHVNTWPLVPPITYK